MNDTVEKGASCLAVVEKKPQRPGGCVGIFFQLFDWNRRFAKKKLLNKKLLPPVRFKQASKKFGGDEKQPNLRLIADENSGGFPTVKNKNNNNGAANERKHEMRVPGLVARLMGLESMPLLHIEKSKKVSASGKAEKTVGLNVEKEGIKHDLRPQKLQKTTNVCERQPITRFVAAEKLPFKNVLLKSRKNHAKLPSPVKSPRNLSKNRSSKLIGAATRILEPGLQTSRTAKCALTYSNTSRHPPPETYMDERTHILSSQLKDSDGYGSVAANGESSCRNCGYLLDNLNRRPAQPLVFAAPFSHCVDSSCQGSERSKPGQSAFKPGQSAFDQEVLHEDYPVVSGPIISNRESHFELASYNRPCTGVFPRHMGSQQCKPLKPHRQNQMSRARETVPLRPNLNRVTNSRLSTPIINRTQNFLSANQSLSCSSTRSQVPARTNTGSFDLEKRITNNFNDSVPPGRKRRPANMSRQGENSGLIGSSTINKQKGFGSPHAMAGKQLGYNVPFINHQCSRNELLHLQDRKFDCQADNNAVSFPFISPVKQKRVHEVAERRVQSGLYRYDDNLKKSALGENGSKTKMEKPCRISGDALGALLEHKLKELSRQEEDISNAPKKTTATILQELITALTSEVPFQQDNLPAVSDRRNGWLNQSRMSNSTPLTRSQANAMGMKLSLESEHLSPGSVLEAYFSTDSCPSSSQDDNLVYKVLSESLNYGPQLLNPDSELLDSAASLNTAARSSKELVDDILNNVAKILCRSNLSYLLKGNKLDEAKRVLLNAELVFHNASLSGSVVGRGSPIKHLLLDGLETLASVLWMNFGCSLGIEDGKEANQLRRFVLDSIIEYLGIRFQGYPGSGYKVSRKFPLCMNDNMLILEIVEVVRKWEEFSQFSLDELIETEMSRSLGEWTECESEAVETGIEISGDVFQFLVDEIVMDLFGESS